jgi:hypothetical protein
MGRAKLPEARIEPRGVDGHLARLKADARQHARAAGRVGVVVARVVGWTSFAASIVALLVWLAPPPRMGPQFDDLRRIQADVARSQANLEQARRAMEQWQHINQMRLTQDVPRLEQLQLLSPESLPYTPHDVPATPSWPPEPASAYSQPSATKAERAEARAAAREHKRAERTAR